MGKRGPKKQPTALRILRGNPSGKRLPTHEPTPRPLDETASPPAWLGDAAQGEWRRVAPLLARNGLLTELDTDALTAYSHAFAEWREASQKLQQFGMVVKAPSGFPMISPYWAIATRASEKMRRMMIEFGMTPASRASVATTAPPTPFNPLNKFLR